VLAHDTTTVHDDRSLRDISPMEFHQLMNDFRRSLPPDGREVLRQESTKWGNQPNVQRWKENQARTGNTGLWIRQQDQARQTLKNLGARFVSHSPLSHSMYGPPEAPYPPLHARQRLREIIEPAVMGELHGIDELVATAQRYDNLVIQLNANQRGPIGGGKVSTGASNAAGANSGGLAAEYGIGSTANNKLNNYKKEKDQNAARQRSAGRKQREAELQAIYEAEEILMAMQWAMLNPLSFSQAREMVNGLLQHFGADPVAQEKPDLSLLLGLAIGETRH
jgi:hypothetical protein